jgi:cell division transport system permease protein
MFYCLRQGVANIRRNKLFSLASIGTIAACIFLISVILTIIINVNLIEKKVESKVGITIFFDEGIAQEQIDSIGKVIKESPMVDSYSFTSAEEAWASFKDDYFESDPELAEGFEKDNPLADSASYTVYLKNINDQDKFVAQMKKLEGVRKVNYSDKAKTTLSNVARLLGYASIALIFILLAVGIFLISNTVMIGITVRRQEIKIMKLIGATNRFVRAPFIIEGVLIGIIGSIIPLLIMGGVYTRMINFVMTKFGVLAKSINFASMQQIFSVLIPLGLGIGAGIGFVGSILSIRKHLKV